MKGILLFLLITSSIFAQNTELNKTNVDDLVFHETLRLKDSTIAENYGKLNFFSTITTADVELVNYESGEKLSWKGTKIVDSLKLGIYFVNVSAPDYITVVDTIRIVNKEITFENVIMLKSDSSNWIPPFDKPNEEDDSLLFSQILYISSFPQSNSLFFKLFRENQKMLYPDARYLGRRDSYVIILVRCDGKIKLLEFNNRNNRNYPDVETFIDKLPNFIPTQPKPGLFQSQSLAIPF